MLYNKPDFINGCRLGLIMYGFGDNLKSTFKLISEVIQINKLNVDETLGYNGIYKASKEELIAVIPIGYADGIIRANTGRYVYINNKNYKIVGNICMDSCMIDVTDIENVEVGTDVYIWDNNIRTLEDIAKECDTINYEILSTISYRVPRIFINRS